MKIGVVREIKDKENRVALTPDGAKRLAAAGHEILVEQDAGLGSGFSNEEYLAAGARTVPVENAWDTELVLKVKEPEPAEYAYFNRQILFTYLHLAGVNPALTDALLASDVTAVAYETLEDAHGRLPLLAPMSAIAGDMASLMGAYYLAGFNGGRGMLPGMVLGRRFGKVVIVGDGVVGQHAARVAAGMGANVLMAGVLPDREAYLKENVHESVRYFISTPEALMQELTDADLVVGAVLLPGARAPHVLSREMIRAMPDGAVVVDVSIDQGGCVETSRPTSHSNPVYVEEGVIHYCVTNMPGAYPRTSTLALTTATLPYVQKLAEQGVQALEASGFDRAVNVYRRHLTSSPVAEALGLESRFRDFHQLLAE